MPRGLEKPGKCKVEHDSSVIRDPKAQESFDTLSKVEKAFPPGENPQSALPPASPLKFDDDEYHMAHRHRGKAIIFNHYEYEPSLSLNVREGTQIDCTALEDTFKKLKFSVQSLNDPTKNEIIQKLKQEKTNQHLYTVDCLIVVVLTHGLGNNLLYAKDNLYSLSELWSPFLADNCPYLASKPKIFIIQACRGDSVSKAVLINKEKMKLTTDSMSTRVEPPGEPFSIPAEADILLAFSSFEGKVAHRDVEEGTWYISELCNELNKNWETDDLLTMLTRVNRHVAITKENKQYNGANKQMPSIQSTLTRKIFFSENRNKMYMPKSSLDELHQKVDHLVTLQNKSSQYPEPSSATNPTPPHYPHGTMESALNEWNGLRLMSDVNFPNVTLRDDDILRLAKGLRMFLEERAIKDDIQENGSLILILLSMWNHLDFDVRQQVYSKLNSFLKIHAGRWPYLELMYFPATDHDGSPRSRKSSRASTPAPNVSQLSRQKPPFKP